MVLIATLSGRTHCCQIITDCSSLDNTILNAQAVTWPPVERDICLIVCMANIMKPMSTLARKSHKICGLILTGKCADVACTVLWLHLWGHTEVTAMRASTTKIFFMRYGFLKMASTDPMLPQVFEHSFQRCGSSITMERSLDSYNSMRRTLDAWTLIEMFVSWR